MSWVPTSDASAKAKEVDSYQGIEKAVVTKVPANGSHVIETKITAPSEGGMVGPPIVTWVTAGVRGDVTVPAEGDIVAILMTRSDRAVCLGSLYTRENPAPDYEAEERLIGHRHSDAEVKYLSDGTIRIECDSGDKIEVDATNGEVSINDGTNPVAYDVNTTTDVDGHVTSVSLVTSDKLLVPS